MSTKKQIYRTPSYPLYEIECHFCGKKETDKNFAVKIMSQQYGYVYCDKCENIMKQSVDKYYQKVCKNILQGVEKLDKSLNIPINPKFLKDDNLIIPRSDGTISYGRITDESVIKYRFGWAIETSFMIDQEEYVKRCPFKDLYDLNMNLIDLDKMDMYSDLHRKAIAKLLE